jgi:hypothetical protein
LHRKYSHRSPKLPEHTEELCTTRLREPLLHVAIYACADKLGISSLKTVGQKKFIAAARSITDKAFAQSLGAVYENTAARDDGPKAAATQHILTLKIKVVDFPEIVEVLKKHEPMVWAMVQVYGKDLENRFKDHSELKASPASTKGKMDTIKLDRQRSIWALLSSLSIYGTDHRRARCWESRPGLSRIPIMAFLVLKQPSLPFPTSPSRCHHLPLAKRQIDPA